MRSADVTGAPMTISQRVAAALALRPLLAAEGKRRQAHGMTAPGKRKTGSSGHRHNTLAILGAKVGMAGNTLLKAIKVVEAARANPERMEGVVRKMDDQQNVEAAYTDYVAYVLGRSQHEIFTTTVVGDVALGEFTTRQLRWLCEFFAELGTYLGVAHDDDVRATFVLAAGQVERAVARADRALDRHRKTSAPLGEAAESCRKKRSRKPLRSVKRQSARKR